MNIKRAVEQHIEMENFFSGGQYIRSKVVKMAYAKTAAKPTRNKGSSETAQKELEEIANEVKQCRKCEIGSTRTNAVPGEGNAGARIFFIGEAPGADEDAQGRPFVGRAGQLLDRIIAAMGLKREDVYIGNILKCRPPENRTPKAEEIINCLPFLQRQIEIIKPDIIVALGAYAAQTLLETTKAIGQLRGHFFDYYPGLGKPPIKLLATFHPAYLLRNYTVESRQKVWEDMKKVLAELDLPIPK
jgi:DNA polymerase